MIKGTTPTITWNLLEIPGEAIAEAYMTIRNINGKKLEWSLDTAIVEKHHLRWQLTQAETLQLGGEVAIQLRYKVDTKPKPYIGASPIYTRYIEPVLKKGEI